MILVLHAGSHREDMFYERRGMIHVCKRQHTFLNFRPAEAFVSINTYMACKQELSHIRSLTVPNSCSYSVKSLCV